MNFDWSYPLGSKYEQLLHNLQLYQTLLISIGVQVIDLLLFKGTEELNNVVEHSKQRHHIIGQYILGRKEISQDQGTKVETQTPFLQNFYKGNYC